MSARTMSATASAAIALWALFAAPSVVAQSMPNITAPKTAANNAAAATNEHIRAEQNPAQTPAKPAAPPAPATARQATPPAAPKPGAAPAKAPPPAPGAAPVKGQAAVATATPARGQAAAPAKGQPVAAGKGAGAAATAAPDQANSVSQRGGKSEISLLRETFTYQSENRRDPFLSLMRTGDLRPMVSDLRLVAVIYDPAGRSVAILRDLQTKEQYRVKVGQTLGRMRVNQIRPQQVIFTIEEIGMTRQEALAMNDVTKARTQ